MVHPPLYAVYQTVRHYPHPQVLALIHNLVLVLAQVPALFNKTHYLDHFH